MGAIFDPSGTVFASTPKERDIEAYLVERCKALGWGCYKFTSPGRRNVPDRIVIAPGGTVLFVELKAPGKRPTTGQAREHERLRALGCVVYVADSLDAVDAVLWPGRVR